MRAGMHACMYVWLVSCMSVCPVCGSAYVRPCLSVCLSVCERACMSVSLSVRYVPACVRACLSLSVCLCLRACVRACLPPCPPVCLSICMSVCLYVCLCLSVCLSVCQDFSTQCNNSEVRSKSLELRSNKNGIYVSVSSFYIYVCVRACVRAYVCACVLAGVHACMYSKKISNDQELIQSDPISCQSKRYQGTRILKSDCKQPLRIGIIRALNECTGRLFRATTSTTTRALICKVKR